MALTPCLQAFIASLTAPLRYQLKLLLQTIKSTLQMRLATLAANINRNDIVAHQYKLMMDQVEASLKPIENILQILPIDSLDACVEGKFVFSTVDDTYYNIKHLFQDYVYQYAQFGFASTYTSLIREEIENQLTKIDAVITYIDTFVITGIGVGSHVRIYSTGQAGIVTNINYTLNTVNINIDGGGTTTVPSGSVGVIQ